MAHYYWGGNEDWMDEGAADFMASVIDGARTGRPLSVTNAPCGHAGSLAELENLGISKGDIEFQCNYSLGERLFVDLYVHLETRDSGKASATCTWRRWLRMTTKFPELRWVSSMLETPLAPMTVRGTS